MRACSTGVFGSCLRLCAPLSRPPSAAAETNNCVRTLESEHESRLRKNARTCHRAARKPAQASFPRTRESRCATHDTELGGASPLRAARSGTLAKGNCVAVMRGGEEAGGKTGSRRTGTRYKASAVGQPGMGRGRPIFLLPYAAWMAGCAASCAASGSSTASSPPDCDDSCVTTGFRRGKPASWPPPAAGSGVWPIRCKLSWP